MHDLVVFLLMCGGLYLLVKHRRSAGRDKED